MNILNEKSQTFPFTYGFVLLSKFNSLTLSSLVEPLRIANYCDGRKLYNWQLLSVDAGDRHTSSGMTVATQAIATDDTVLDAIIICGGWNAERYDNDELYRWLRRMARRGVILGAVETGTYVLARAGLMSGYAATIHWHCHDAFEERYPDISLKDQLFVIDRKRMTCAGGIACLDMMLQDIENRYGKSLALEVADQLVYFPEREAELPQKEIHTRKQSTMPSVLQRAIEFMEQNIEDSVTIPELSRRLKLSQRKLERLFNKQFRCSAVAFYRGIRLQKARVLLTHTDMSVLDICIACGFSSSSYFSKSYTDQFGMRPRDHRTAWPDNKSNVFWPGVAASMVAFNKTMQRKIKN